MNRKYILIGLSLIILALVIGIGVSLLSPSEVTYDTLNISSTATIEVPKTDDVSWVVNENGLKSYECPSKKVVMVTYNTAESSSIEGGEGFEAARDMWLNGANDVEVYNGYEIKENIVNDTHYYIASIGNEITHDNIVIGSENLDILKHMLDSLVFTNPGITEDNENSTMNDTSSDDSANQDSGYPDDSSSSSSQTSTSSNSNSQSSASSPAKSSSSSSSSSGTSHSSSSSSSSSGSGSSSSGSGSSSSTSHSSSGSGSSSSSSGSSSGSGSSSSGSSSEVAEIT